ncbi:MAG: hypothetical protein AVDCRST_MAG89-1508, partial [uncultured Gemmatimonadetes bacterium]
GTRQGIYQPYPRCAEQPAIRGRVRGGEQRDGPLQRVRERCPFDEIQRYRFTVARARRSRRV